MTTYQNLNQLLQVSLNEIQVEKAKRHLKHFIKYTFRKYQIEPFHELVADTLDAVISGASDRLMIFAPPQHGKSQLASVHLPAYWLGKNPDMPVILASYGASLAYSKSRQARSIVESVEYADIFPDVRTNPESRARDNWSILGHQGELVAAGVGGPITGHGAKLGIIDDPFENWEQAQSKTIREKVWEWYRTTFRTRIWENGRIVIIMTRWHEDDLCGKLIEEQGDNWQILRLPAIAENQKDRDRNNESLGLPRGQPDPLRRKAGEPLCPLRFSKESLLELKTDVGPMGWNAEYQGIPTAPEGNEFKREWFVIIDDLPAHFESIVRYWDKAATQDGGDYTVGILMGSIDGLYYVIDVVRGQWSTGNRENVMKQTAEMDYQDYGNKVKVYHEEEPGSSGKDSAEATNKNLAGYPVFAVKSTGSKEVRAQPFIAQCAAGNVRLLKAKWNKAYIDELCAFPNGTNDDQIDGSSGAFNKIVKKKRAKVKTINMSTGQVVSEKTTIDGRDVIQEQKYQVPEWRRLLSEANKN